MQSPTSAVLSPLDAAWPNLTSVFEIKDADEVRDFLPDHPTLLELLFEIREAVRPYFGDDPMLLHISFDPEWEEAEPELIAAVLTKRGRHALACLERFDREWWLPKLKETDAPAHVTMYHAKRV